jgi:hypothetical protein
MTPAGGAKVMPSQLPVLVAERLAAHQDDYVPKVLVVGATGEVGRLVVQQLQLTEAGSSHSFGSVASLQTGTCAPFYPTSSLYSPQLTGLLPIQIHGLNKAFCSR